MRTQILQATHWGLDIYAHVLRLFYPTTFNIKTAQDNAVIVRNPFNANAQTLQIKLHPTINGLVARHFDIEKPDFNGDAFDFASLYYKQSGDELMLTLNHELYLHIGEGYLPEAEPTRFSFFRSPINNAVPYRSVTLKNVAEVIQMPYYQGITERLRGMADKNEARAFKARAFDFCTFSGVFNVRKSEALIKHSGLLCLDFDHVEDYERLRNSLLGDTMFETQLLFRSPSGDGIKWVITTSMCNLSHSEYFSAVANYVDYTYNIKVDRSGRDVCRACFLPYDPDIYINPNLK